MLTSRLSIPLLALAALTLSACCMGGSGGGEGLFGKSARESFIPSFNQNGIKGCDLKGVGAELKDLEYTCKSHPLGDLEKAIVPACAGFQLVGFEKMTVHGKDGTATSDIKAGGCKFKK